MANFDSLRDDLKKALCNLDNLKLVVQELESFLHGSTDMTNSLTSMMINAFSMVLNVSPKFASVVMNMSTKFASMMTNVATKFASMVMNVASNFANMAMNAFSMVMNVTTNATNIATDASNRAANVATNGSRNAANVATDPSNKFTKPIDLVHAQSRQAHIQIVSDHFVMIVSQL
jgi:cell division septum initiation protein DivIVA